MEIDKQLVSQRFAKHYEDYQKRAVVQRCIATQLAVALSAHCPHAAVERALEIGMGTGFLSRRLAKLHPQAYWYFNDMVPEAAAWIPEDLAHKQSLMGDAEQIELPLGLDLIASASALQWLRDLDGFFVRAHAALNEGGIFAFSSFGPTHMRELRQLTGMGLHYPSAEELSLKLIAAGFLIIHQEEWEQPLHFDSARHVLEHLRQTGVNSTAAQTWTPRKLLHFCRQYEAEFRAEDAGLPLHYHPVLFIVQRPNLGLT